MVENVEEDEVAVVLHGLAESLHAVAEEGLDGVHGDMQVIGALLVFHVVEQDAGKDFGGLLGHFLDFLGDPIHDFLTDGSRRVGRHVHIGEVHGVAQGILAVEVGVAAIADGDKKIGGQSGSLDGGEGVALPKGEEQILHEILGGHLVAHELGGEHHQRAVVPLEQQLDAFAFVRRQDAQYFLVASAHDFSLTQCHKIKKKSRSPRRGNQEIRSRHKEYRSGALFFGLFCYFCGNYKRKEYGEQIDDIQHAEP